MAQEPEDIIDSYTDAQAVEDGFLVEVGYMPVNRVTRTVFDRFTHQVESSPQLGMVTDTVPLRRLIQKMLAVEADADGWRKGTYADKELWLVPNEVGGLTLMFPKDY